MSRTARRITPDSPRSLHSFSYRNYGYVNATEAPVRALPKPDEMFDRTSEWSALSSFGTDERLGATLGIVSGRRRQGKTFLLRALCQATGGFYFAADEATDGESLARSAWSSPSTCTVRRRWSSTTGIRCSTPCSLSAGSGPLRS